MFLKKVDTEVNLNSLVESHKHVNLTNDAYKRSALAALKQAIVLAQLSLLVSPIQLVVMLHLLTIYSMLYIINVGRRELLLNVSGRAKHPMCIFILPK